MQNLPISRFHRILLLAVAVAACVPAGAIAGQNAVVLADAGDHVALSNGIVSSEVNVEKDGQWLGAKWNIQFDLPAKPASGTATLRVAFASTHAAKLVVAANDQPVGRIVTGSDNAMIRASNHGQYSEVDIAFDATLLKSGMNTISLEQTAGGSVQKSVMYDCLRLELDEERAFHASKK